mmetsp:Transcript_4140/g.8124  ORF Transcript_4140/g.8124 Transcript_4140/m.8124 type:complete len:123 (+) Transcript_4140:1561-1929(+)
MFDLTILFSLSFFFCHSPHCVGVDSAEQRADERSQAQLRGREDSKKAEGRKGVKYDEKKGEEKKRRRGKVKNKEKSGKTRVARWVQLEVKNGKKGGWKSKSGKAKKQRRSRRRRRRRGGGGG